MASPTSRFAASHRANARIPGPPALHQPRTVYVGKEQYPINLTPLVDVSSATWKKQRGFDQLESAVLSLRNTHEVADLMELVRQEVMIDVDSAAQDAAGQMQRVMESVHDVRNLNAAAFVGATGNQLTLVSGKLSDRPEGLSFFRFSFSLDPSSIDARISQKPVFFTFCLRLPQHRYHKAEDKIEEIFSPIARTTPRKAAEGKMERLFGPAKQLFQTPGGDKTVTSDDEDNTTAAFATTNESIVAATRDTPKMNALFGGGADILIGYFGDLDFIDNQGKFDSTFGSNPVILPTIPTKPEHTNAAQLLLDLSEQCRLDVYLNACRKFYVGTTIVDRTTSMMEVCREISELRQEYKDSNGRMVADTPEELFMKVLALTGSLPECAQGWPIQLCSTYYTALSNSISSRMMACKDYTTPSLVGLNTKRLQLEALQQVREGATRHHKELVEEDLRLDKKLKTMIRAGGRNTQAYFAGSSDNSRNDGQPIMDTTEGNSNHYLLGYGDVHQYRGTPNDGRRGNMGTGDGNVYAYGQEPSLAEGVLTKYKGALGVPTKRDPVTGVEYPFDAEYNFVSRFAVGFNGCFICGATNHFSRTDCPVGIRTKDERRLFFNEMWAHKPHTKRSNVSLKYFNSIRIVIFDIIFHCIAIRYTTSIYILFFCMIQHEFCLIQHEFCWI